MGLGCNLWHALQTISSLLLLPCFCIFLLCITAEAIYRLISLGELRWIMDCQWCPWERPIGKTPKVGLQGSEGSFQVKDALERPSDPSGVFLRGLSLGHHWRSVLYMLRFCSGKDFLWRFSISIYFIGNWSEELCSLCIIIFSTNY